MSADNYNLVKRCGGCWKVWLNLSASHSREEALACRATADRSFDDKFEAIKWADAQGFTEYGTEVDRDEGWGLIAQSGLEALAKAATPSNARSRTIDPDNPLWGPRLKRFREASDPGTVTVLIAVVRAAVAYVSSGSVDRRVEYRALQDAVDALEKTKP